MVRAAMKFSRLIQPLIIIFALLFIQQGAVVHGISHTLTEQSQDHSLPHDKYCELCAAYAQVGGAIASGIVHFEFTQTTTLTFGKHFTVAHVACFDAFAARAPPSFQPHTI
jgi:hypothetical protein